MNNNKKLMVGTALVTFITVGGFSISSVSAAEIDAKDSQGTAAFTKGELTLDFVSSFDFGTHPISVDNEVYTAAPQKLDDGREVPNYAQVTDLRGSAAGWTLSVQQKGQFVSVKEGSELEGAQIKFTNGQVASESTSTPKDVANSAELAPGVTEKLVFSNIGEGTGTWVYGLGDDATKGSSVELAVPGKSFKAADAYKTVLTWSLSDVPTN